MGKRLMRRAAVVAVVAAGVVATAGAPALAAPSRPGDPYRTADGWCHFRNWGGTFYCSGGGGVRWAKPDGWDQVFVIGTNRSVYTRWANAQDTYNWLNYGGTCLPDRGIHANVNGWSIAINCIGTDGQWWHRKRSTSGAWTGWIKGPGFPD